ncbi:MAG: hypothetical protein K5705_13570 [Oscillospiraceae bacterium]|nr:hypothetical protein [Oscillospiraceae bacterium]
MKTKMIFTAALSVLAACVPVNALAAPTEKNTAAVYEAFEDENGGIVCKVSTETDENADMPIYICCTAAGDSTGCAVVEGDGDFGDLTKEELDELKNLFARQNAIYDEVCGGDTELTEAEYEAALDARRPELDVIEARIHELLEKSGEEVYIYKEGDCMEYASSLTIDDDGTITYMAGDGEGTELTEDEVNEFLNHGTLTRTLEISDGN